MATVLRVNHSRESSMSDTNEAHDTAGAVDAEGRQIEADPKDALARLEACIRAQPVKSVLIGACIGYVIGRLRLIV
jgi:ElaB/YqjD/DUF883 family membrane-anchored ribosome-binding protein